MAFVVNSNSNVWTASKDGSIKKWTPSGELVKTVNLNKYLNYKDIPYHKHLNE